MIRVTVWNEFVHEKTEESIRKIYPDGIHKVIADFLGKNEDMVVTTAVLDDPEHGLTDEVLNNTDVLIWWGHMCHHKVSDAVVAKVTNHVLRGMGFIALHSAHFSKPFKALLGTNGNLSWGRNQREVIWNVLPSHPITKGLPDHFTLESEELYCEPFYIPQPDELVFNAWYEDGYVFRAGACWHKGAGKVFYFQPGHEEYPIYYHPQIQKIITNAVRWAKPVNKRNNNYDNVEVKHE